VPVGVVRVPVLVAGGARGPDAGEGSGSRGHVGAGRLVSVDTYRAAAVRLRDGLSAVGSYAGPCECCGGPDSRHRVADAITDRVIAGEAASSVAREFLSRPFVDPSFVVHELVIAVLAAHPGRHRMTRGRAAGIDREVWADLLDQAPVAR
jgi:hypothetical protein